MLTEEVNMKNLDNTCSSGNVLIVRGRSSETGRNQVNKGSHSISHVVRTTKMLSAIIVTRRGI